LKASDIFVRQLEEEGVKYVFGLPGEENLDLLESLRTSSIKLIVTRHEQAAAFMAATYGRLTGKAGVVLSTLGPGATNLVTGIAHAQLIGAPLVAISGQKALKQNWQARFQLIDVVSLMRPITKKSTQIVDPGNIPTIVRDAFRTAEAERPGAAHIELPEDVAEVGTDAKVQSRTYSRRPSPEYKAISKAVQLISKAKNPLIIISAGANRKLITKHLLDFVEKTGIYVVSTQMGKGVIPDDSKYSMFATGIHAKDYVNCGIDAADLIITIGYDIVEYPPFVWNRDLRKKIVNIDFNESEPDRYFNPDVEVTGDIAYSLILIGDRLKKREFPIFAETRQMIEEVIDHKARKGFPLHPQRIVQVVRENLGREDILALDNGIYKLWFSRLYKTYAPNSFLVDNALATKGAGLPAAIAAKIVHPERNVLAVVGDGGFMMNSQELETARRYKIPVKVLILNDNGFGFIKWKQQNMKLHDFGMDLGNPDFVKLAASYGMKGFRVQKIGDLESMLKRALSSPESAIIECPIDYTSNKEFEKVRKAVCP